MSDDLVYDPFADEWYPPDEPRTYRYCPLCGDAGIQEGFECRKVKQAKAVGQQLPFDPMTGERQP